MYIFNITFEKNILVFGKKSILIYEFLTKIDVSQLQIGIISELINFNNSEIIIHSGTRF